MSPKEFTNMPIGLGLDTGGTYTDAVLMEMSDGSVLCKAKSLTTREDLCIGIRGSISGFDRELLSKVCTVSLSSTLATNSIVEGKGCRVGLVCIGYDYDGSVRTDFSVTVSGGHDLHGAEKAPLDEAAAREFLESLKGRVDAIAVNGYLAIRNPDHETRVRDMAKEILDVPVVCGHELSSNLGFNERTATCVMNAMLIPVIDDLLRSVRSVLEEYEIHAPLMIVRGDGAMMSEAMAKSKPVETILCGPAASLVGAMHMTGLKDAIVMDMGGTTTDIGILRDGKPRLEPEGAIIGGKRTHVMAAEIATSGIGGDSRIIVNGRRIILSSVRVMPLCIAASQWDCVAENLKAVAERRSRTTPEALGEDNIVLDSEMFRTLRIPEEGIVSTADMKLLKLAVDRPYTLKEAGEVLDLHPFSFNVARMESRGYIQRIGMTPTDLLHADGTYRRYDAEASMNGVRYMAGMAGITGEEFISRSKSLIRDKLCVELMKELIMEETGSMDLGDTAMDLINKSIHHEFGRDYGCKISLNKPIIGIGAPAGVYIRWVGEVFGTDVVIHEDADVGNAIGAITSSVSESVEFLIKPETIGATECKFEVFSKLGNTVYETLEEAVSASEALGREYVTKIVSEGGVSDISVSVDKKEKRFSFGGDGDDMLMDMVMTVTAAGKPSQFSA